MLALKFSLTSYEANLKSTRTISLTDPGPLSLSHPASTGWVHFFPAPMTVDLLLSFFLPQMLQLLHALFVQPFIDPKLLGDIPHSKLQTI